MKLIRTGVTALSCALISSLAFAQEQRRIEEIVVTAEKRESTVSDTSISITAFGEDMIEDFGIQGADELVNFIPATTRDAYDIRIRGVGRNFRALGGDPGVATYYNGIYSEDFGIASSENGLYDVERIEALRGPQGTLYGRNSIGGALNYITNKPTYEFEGELRALGGNLNTQEYYGILSGPIIADTLAYRIVGVMRDRDGSQDGLAGSEDINSINDENFSVSLLWNIAENWEMNVRWNDRSSDRIIGQSSVVREGALGDRAARNTGNYARGLRPVGPTDPGAMMFTSPSGTVAYGAYNRPGVDFAASAVPNPGFGLGGLGLELDPDIDDLEGHVATNNDNNEKFIQNGVQFDLTWDINENTSLKYLGGWSDFDYTFDIDLDYTNGEFAQPRQTVLEAVETFSHELQLLWQIGDNLQMTSGLYFFSSDRLQNYAFRDRESQGRFTRPTNYGGALGFAAFAPPEFGGPQLNHTRRGASGVGASTYGLWEGDPTGAYYEYWNKVETEASAVYTQGTYTFNEEWAITLGVRWAEDEKSAFEDRTGQFEANLSQGAFAGLGAAFDGFCDSPLGFNTDCSALGLTPLAIANIFAGNAVPTFNPANPIAPTCALTDPDCTTPMWLVGIPYSFADQAEGDDDWGDTSFRVNLDWTPNEETLVYASITTGYRAGGYSLGIGDSRGAGNFGNIVPSTYEQEEVVAYEIGYKGTLMDGQLQVNLSTYLYQYDDYQDRIEIFNSASGTSLDQVQNAEEAQNMGIEVEFMWLATDSLTLGGNGSWTDTEYKSDQFVLEDDNPAYPINLFPGDFALVANLKGNELKRIPEWKYTIWGTYAWSFASGTLTAGATYAYTGEYSTSGLVRSLDEVPERDRLDVSLTWRDNKDQWVVRGFVDNVLDETHTRGLGTATASNDWRLTAEQLYPRFYGVDVTFRFGAM
jgi:iron complex outermembrane recepter protein